MDEMKNSGAEGSVFENEGRMALLLKRLSEAECENEKTAVAADLEKLTGNNFGVEISKWLAWFLEDHLGMRNVISILTGKDSPMRKKREFIEDGDEQVFNRAEYNWCALERVHNKDDMVKLRMLYDDLEQPVDTEEKGPFSFMRLCGVDADEAKFFNGKSISEALFHEEIQIRHLRALKDYGKMMMMPLFPNATQRSGAILYAASISQALVKFDAKITSLSYKDLSESIPGLLERPYLVDSYLKLFREALEKCQ